MPYHRDGRDRDETVAPGSGKCRWSGRAGRLPHEFHRWAGNAARGSKLLPIIAADMVAAIGGSERGQESGARSAAGPRPRFGDDLEAGSKATPKKKGQPHANLAGTGPELCGREEAV